MPLAYARIGRPLEAHGVRTVEDYRGRQRQILADLRAAYPTRPFPEPWVSTRTVTPRIDCGRWIVDCPHCGNGPSYDPEWQMALCCECGASFEHVVPTHGYEEIEAALLVRPLMHQRFWVPGERAADLARETAAHGDH